MKLTRPRSWSGLIATISAPRRRASSSVVSMRGWFVPGFCPITKIASAFSKSASCTLPLPTPTTCAERDAARLVAHVRAVGEVVRAEHAPEELIEERGLVARAARGVEDRAVGIGEGGEALARDPERVVPRDRLVAVGALAPDHRVGEPPLRLEPVVGSAAQLGDRVGREERGVDALARSPRRRPPSRRSRRTRSRPRCSGSGQAQPGQSKPSAWFTRHERLEPRTQTAFSLRSWAIIAATAGRPPAGFGGVAASRFTTPHFTDGTEKSPDDAGRPGSSRTVYYDDVQV